ncbi:UNVERIFIED_CONTAM: hypothetical protein Sangu_2722600 [Sesamum angustifolium]|uniref:Uncharacterized protein n=1 Tax=Sesamum angustifolium TaxID=2727405 RepID=A0AAW2IX69_9LAMI
MAIKAQILVILVNQTTLVEEDEGIWFLHMDGSSNLAGSGAKAVLTSPKGDELDYALRFDFKGSNNDAKCEVVITRTKLALDAGAINLTAYSDS